MEQITIVRQKAIDLDVIRPTPVIMVQWDQPIAFHCIYHNYFILTTKCQVGGLHELVS